MWWLPDSLNLALLFWHSSKAFLALSSSLIDFWRIALFDWKLETTVAELFRFCFSNPCKTFEIFGMACSVVDTKLACTLDGFALFKAKRRLRLGLGLTLLYWSTSLSRFMKEVLDLKCAYTELRAESCCKSGSMKRFFIDPWTVILWFWDLCPRLVRCLYVSDSRAVSYRVNSEQVSFFKCSNCFFSVLFITLSSWLTFICIFLDMSASFKRLWND